MEYIYIGKIVNTHGLKGEIKILSDFEFKNKVFIKDMPVYIGINYEKQIINTYRKHQEYDMITLNNLIKIEDVLKYKGLSIYVNKEDIKLETHLETDLIGFNVYMNDYVGNVLEIVKGVKYNFLLVNKTLIPNIKPFIKNIDINNKRIDLNEWEGLFNEN